MSFIRDFIKKLYSSEIVKNNTLNAKIATEDGTIRTPDNLVLNSNQKLFLIPDVAHPSLQSELEKIGLAHPTFQKIQLDYHYFYKAGQNIIKYKNQAIYEQLINTDVKDLTVNDFKMDKDCYYLELEKNFEGLCKVHGVFITRCGKDLELNCLYTHGISNTLDAYYISIYHNKKIEDSIQENFEIYKQSNLETYRTAGEKFYRFEENKDKVILDYAVKLAINTLLFMDYIRKNDKETIMLDVEDKRLKNIPTFSNNKQFKKQIKKVVEANYYYILKNDSNANKLIQNSLSSDKKIEKSFWVTGHFRNQPYGKRDEEKEFKLIWIEPYLKGVGMPSSDISKLNINVL